jgi:hypothetical protein
MKRLLLGLEVVEEDGALLRLLTPVLDNDARAVDNLAGVTLTVNLACCVSISTTYLNHSAHQSELTETGPLAELLAIRDLDERDLVLAAKSNDELLVGLLLASLVEDAHVCLATVKSLGSLTETAGESIVDQRDLEDTLEGIEDGHGTGLSGLIGANFDLLGGGDGAGGLFYIRLFGAC